MKVVKAVNDTSAEALAVQLDGLRNMLPQRRLEVMLALSAGVRRQAFAALGRRNTAWTQEELNLRFIELACGKALADEVRTWQSRDPE